MGHPCEERWKDNHKDQVLEYRRQYYQRKRLQILDKARQKYSENKKIFAVRNKARYIPTQEMCEFCGSTENLERHHPDYDEPMMFITVCKTCHNWIHKRMGE